MTAEVLKAIEKAKKFGFQTKEDGTKMFGKVPHVAPLAWFHVLFSPIAEREVRKLEKNIKQLIPKPYRDFLINENNGLSLFSGSFSLYGFRKHYDRTSFELLPFDLGDPNVLEKPIDASAKQFIIGGYYWDGTLVYMDREDYSVHRSSRETIKPLNSWKSLDDFLLQEVKRLSLLFDSLGKEKNADTSTAPNPQVESINLN